MSAWWQEWSRRAGRGSAGTVAVQKEVGVVGWNGELHGQARVEESVNAALFIEVPWEGGAQNRVDAHKSRGRSGTPAAHSNSHRSFMTPHAYKMQLGIEYLAIISFPTRW